MLETDNPIVAFLYIFGYLGNFEMTSTVFVKKDFLFCGI